MTSFCNIMCYDYFTIFQAPCFNHKTSAWTYHNVYFKISGPLTREITKPIFWLLWIQSTAKGHERRHEKLYEISSTAHEQMSHIMRRHVKWATSWENLSNEPHHEKPCQMSHITRKPVKWATSWENLSSGFRTRVDSNWPAQPQKLGRGLTFGI